MPSGVSTVGDKKLKRVRLETTSGNKKHQAETRDNWQRQLTETGDGAGEKDTAK